MLQEKLELLLEKYDVSTKAEINSNDGEYTVTIDGKVYPLLAHRFERRFTELHKMYHDGTLEGPSHIRCSHIGSFGDSLTRLVRREIDICRYLSDAEVASVTAYTTGKDAMNLILNLTDGVICTIEAATTLPQSANDIDKHEVISRRGFICDRVVDTQVPQQSIYMYCEDGNETYTDVDFELYGLTIDEIAAVRAALELARSEDLRAAALKDSEMLDKIMNAAASSASECKKVQM